ncbi:MAG TPA: hypothetical protein VJN70_06190 [Gemmatimonadaceae bacterium]|nr:hypothetical protein [Gemmatimonadaceae bacterium]
MSNPIRTLPLYAALVGCAVLLGACDNSVTSPAALRPAPPEKIFLFGGVTWTRTDLPFAPAAINGGGVIVGRNGNEAVRWRNGVVDTLPHLAGLAGPYIAVDVTPNGLVLGGANGHILYWFQDGVQQVFTSFNGALTWLSSADASAATPVDVNSCGAIIARRSTSPATGSLWRRTSIVVQNTCDTPPVLVTATAM